MRYDATYTLPHSYIIYRRGYRERGGERRDFSHESNTGRVMIGRFAKFGVTESVAGRHGVPGGCDEDGEQR